LKPGPARRVDPGPGRPGPGTGPGPSKNLPGSWPGETRSTRNPGDPGKPGWDPVFFFYRYTNVKLCRFDILFFYSWASWCYNEGDEARCCFLFSGKPEHYNW
jgi:hypothetical protein